MWRRLLAVLFAVALVAAGCGDDDDGDDESAGATSTTAAPDAPTTTAAGEDTTTTAGGDSPTTEAGEGTTTAASGDAAADLELTSTDLGDIIVDSGGNTVYLFVPDAQGESTCYDECEAAWPIVGEVSTVGAGLDESLLGTTERTNGDVQATYDGWPLYYFANDAAPGDTNGQGVNDVWYVVDAAGEAVGAG